MSPVCSRAGERLGGAQIVRRRAGGQKHHIAFSAQVLGQFVGLAPGVDHQQIETGYGFAQFFQVFKGTSLIVWIDVWLDAMPHAQSAPFHTGQWLEVEVNDQDLLLRASSDHQQSRQCAFANVPFLSNERCNAHINSF